MSNARFSITQARAVSDPEVGDLDFRILAAFGLFSDKDGWCWPAQQTIADLVGCNRQKVNEVVSSLCELGYMQKSARFDENGGQLSNKYRLLFDTTRVGTQATLATPPVNEVEGDADTNAPLNAPINTNTANEEKPSSLPELPLDWKIATGSTITETDLLSEREKKMHDTAMLISTGIGVRQRDFFAIAMTFMVHRDILILPEKVKGQRKAVREMVELGVQPSHVVEAIDRLLENNMTVTDLYSVSKTAIALANPPKQEYNGALEGV